MNKYRLSAKAMAQLNWLRPVEYFRDEWALIPPPSKRGVIPQLWRQSVHCRETLAAHVSTQLICENPKAAFLDAIEGEDGKIYFLCTVLLDCDLNTEKHIEEKKKANKRFARAAGLLNYYEKTFTKWPVTDVDELDPFNSTYRDGAAPAPGTVEVRLIGCSKNWIFSPHLLSLFILIFRAGFYLNYANAVSDVEAELKKTVARFDRRTIGHESNLVRGITYLLRIRDCGKRWGIVLANTKKLYRGLSFRDNWTKERYNGYQFNVGIDGINMLLGGRSTNQIVSKRAKILGLW